MKVKIQAMDMKIEASDVAISQLNLGLSLKYSEIDSAI
jgi:hypothetical protein